MTTAASHQGRRRIPYFGMTLLVILILVITGAALSLWLPYHREQIAIAEIERVGGHTQITNAGLVHLAALAHLKAIWLDNTKVTPTGVEQIRGKLPTCEIMD